jgi:hypothetical protein
MPVGLLRRRSSTVLIGVTAALSCATAAARGVSPYLPLSLSPEIERQIERVMILAGESVSTRPIAAARVLDALPKACELDARLCDQVTRYLDGLEKTAGLNHMSIAGNIASETSAPLANRHGMRSDSGYEISAEGYWQPSAYVLVSAGVLAYDGAAVATDTVASIGTEYAQLDVGYRDHWLSPMTDSAMLISTEAQTLPSLTLSNYTPLTRFGFHYEIFLAELGRSDRIAYQDGFTSGRPRLAGVHVSIEPVPGWSLGFNRLMQFGGGARGGDSLSDIIDAFFRPSQRDNTGTGGNVDTEFGNQVASITSRLSIPGRVPFAVYLEYAGEDTSTNANFRLGNASLSAGLQIPRLGQGFDLTFEISEWQNGWYVHHIYQDGLTNEGNVLGHWGADLRERGDGVGARSLMLRLGWDGPSGTVVEGTYRALRNESYTAPDYHDAEQLNLRYSRRWRQFFVGGELSAGRDVFGESYSRVGAFLRY